MQAARQLYSPLTRWVESDHPGHHNPIGLVPSDHHAAEFVELLQLGPPETPEEIAQDEDDARSGFRPTPELRQLLADLAEDLPFAERPRLSYVHQAHFGAQPVWARDRAGDRHLGRLLKLASAREFRWLCRRLPDLGVYRCRGLLAWLLDAHYRNRPQRELSGTQGNCSGGDVPCKPQLSTRPKHHNDQGALTRDVRLLDINGEVLHPGYRGGVRGVGDNLGVGGWADNNQNQHHDVAVGVASSTADDSGDDIYQSACPGVHSDGGCDCLGVNGDDNCDSRDRDHIRGHRTPAADGSVGAGSAVMNDNSCDNDREHVACSSGVSICATLGPASPSPQQGTGPGRYLAMAAHLARTRADLRWSWFLTCARGLRGFHHFLRHYQTHPDLPCVAPPDSTVSRGLQGSRDSSMCLGSRGIGLAPLMWRIGGPCANPCDTNANADAHSDDDADSDVDSDTAVDAGARPYLLTSLDSPAHRIADALVLLQELGADPNAACLPIIAAGGAHAGAGCARFGDMQARYTAWLRDVGRTPLMQALSVPDLGVAGERPWPTKDHNNAHKDDCGDDHDEMLAHVPTANGDLRLLLLRALLAAGAEIGVYPMPGRMRFSLIPSLLRGTGMAGVRQPLQTIRMLLGHPGNRLFSVTDCCRDLHLYPEFSRYQTRVQAPGRGAAVGDPHSRSHPHAQASHNCLMVFRHCHGNNPTGYAVLLELLLDAGHPLDRVADRDCLLRQIRGCNTGEGDGDGGGDDEDFRFARQLPCELRQRLVHKLQAVVCPDDAYDSGDHQSSQAELRQRVLTPAFLALREASGLSSVVASLCLRAHMPDWRIRVA